MRTQVQHMALAGVVLAIFAMLGSSLLAFTAEATREQIAENERQALLRNLHEVVPPERIDNELYEDTLTYSDPELLGGSQPVTVYRGRRDGQVRAVALTAVAPDGYSGRIRILTGIDRNGEITGVRVVDHHETPGLGDYVELDRSDWVLDFNGRSLSNPGTRQGWGVRRDGGQFEQFTGATITPRAVVKAVYRTLLFVADHRDELFETAPAEERAAVAADPTAAENDGAAQ